MDALKPALARLSDGTAFTIEEAASAFGLVLDGETTRAQTAALLTALHLRGETADELAGAARAMRARMTAVALDPNAIDVCGTGGDRHGTLNVSTAVAFVVAGAGVPVAKHGNRAASSQSGGADVLAALGVRLDPPFPRLPAILAAAGCVFLFAPRHHPGLRHAAPVRAELGFRTLFNLLGPLVNPARVRRQLTGVYDPRWTLPVAAALAALGHTHGWVVHGQGLDELTLAGLNHVVEQRGPDLRAFTLDATTLGFAAAPIADLAGADAAHNADALTALLASTASNPAYRDTVLLNAAAALVVAGRTDDVAAAVAIARTSLDSGAARDCLARLRAASELDE